MQMIKLILYQILSCEQRYHNFNLKIQKKLKKNTVDLYLINPNYDFKLQYLKKFKIVFVKMQNNHKIYKN